jgi:xanthine/CO dehydrogenase XdhC/CoxF family maturation factor
VSGSLQSLLPLFEREQAQSHPMVLATVIRTQGPSYTKPGAQMLITQGGEYAGLLSGGCLEGDLSERAARVLRTRSCELARYDMRGPDDLLFGLGSGCEGAMDILLQRLDAVWDWQPMRRLVAAWKAHRRERLLLVVPPLQSLTAPKPLDAPSMTASSEAPALGSGLFLDDGAAFGVHGAALDALLALARKLPRGSGSRLLPPSLSVSSSTELFLLEQEMQPRILLLGAGADALPVATLASYLGWSVTVVDHRSHFAQPTRFPQAEAVLDGGPQVVPRLLQAACSPARHFDAAIVMSHHLLTDAAYLKALVLSNIPYIGLLGPIVRRERLLSELGPEAARLRGRLRAPIGLDLGAASPETIALSIVAEIQAVLSGTHQIEPLSDKSASADPALPAVALEEPR